MCLVCNVPVGLNDIAHHEQGRAHVYKAAMDGCARISREISFENYMFRRQFGPLLPSIVSQLPPLPQKLVFISFSHLTLSYVRKTISP